jgi:hypothetical protein
MSPLRHGQFGDWRSRAKVLRSSAKSVGDLEPLGTSGVGAGSGLVDHGPDEVFFAFLNEGQGRLVLEAGIGLGKPVSQILGGQDVEQGLKQSQGLRQARADGCGEFRVGFVTRQRTLRNIGQNRKQGTGNAQRAPQRKEPFAIAAGSGPE